MNGFGEDFGKQLPADVCQTLVAKEKGGTRYRFFRQSAPLGSAVIQHGRDFPLVMQRDGLILNSICDPDQTLVPGLCREIVDADNGEIYGRLIWVGGEDYRLVLNWDSGKPEVEVHFRGNRYTCDIGGKTVARTLPFPEAQWGEWARYGWLRLEEPLPEDLVVMLLSLPLLRFAL